MSLLGKGCEKMLAGGGDELLDGVVLHLGFVLFFILSLIHGAIVGSLRTSVCGLRVVGS